MKLVTEIGEITLPSDASLTIEKHNPILSEEGDATTPISIPSTPSNLRSLNHPERIDRSSRHLNTINAVLYDGASQKNGVIVMSSAHDRDGVDAVFATDTGDLYAKAKDKTLKDIFKDADLAENFQSVTDAITVMQNVLDLVTTKDYAIFPIAIAEYELGNGTKVYQYNNEIDANKNLVWGARMVHEGDVLMTVPTGYGVSPQIYLGKLLQRIFECLGYTVKENCFNEYPRSNIVIINNCSDTLVTPKLNYADMAPSCKLSDFITWINDKFHAAVNVDSNTKTVSVVMMEDVLSSKPTQDISDLVADGITVSLNGTKRVVLQPSTEIEGTEPAAETFDALIRKYNGEYVLCNEQEFQSLETSNPQIADCLILRASTGMFYNLERDLVSGKQVITKLGTNYFKYDRNNSDETEQHAPVDVMPLMTCDPKCLLAPFIGERLHFHTNYNGEKEDDNQEIICAYAFKAASGYYAKTLATTQRYVTPADGSDGTSIPICMATYDLYRTFWHLYNTILLNNETRASAKVNLKKSDLLRLDMTKQVLCQGQFFVPVSAKCTINDKPELTDMEFLLNKIFTDSITDEGYDPSEPTGYKWVADFDKLNSVIATAMGQFPRWHERGSQTDWVYGEPIDWNIKQELSGLPQVLYTDGIEHIVLPRPTAGASIDIGRYFNVECQITDYEQETPGNIWQYTDVLTWPNLYAIITFNAVAL